MLQNKSNAKKRRIGIMSYGSNIQGLTNNYNQHEVIVEKSKPDFVILTETHTQKI